MKNILSFVFVLITINSAKAQKLTNTKWYEYYLGGTKGYFVKTHTISNNTFTINQTGSGGNFDNKPSVLPIEIIQTAADERMITKYDDTTYMVIVVKSFTADKAQACVNLEQFKTVQEATDYKPDDKDYTTWYTEAGFKTENAKPAMSAFTKNDMLVFSKFLVDKLNEKSATLEKTLSTDDENFALAMSMLTLPFEYAQSKGYNAYKSLSVFDKGITKFKKDPEVTKLFKDAGFGDLLSIK